MKKLFVLSLLSLVFSCVSAQSDVENSQDYPLLDRLPNYSIIDYKDFEFDSHGFLYDNKKITEEGRRFIIKYRR